MPVKLPQVVQLHCLAVAVKKGHVYGSWQRLVRRPIRWNSIRAIAVAWEGKFTHVSAARAVHEVFRRQIGC